MAPKIKNADQIYFTKDHNMVRRAIADFVKKEINPSASKHNALNRFKAGS